MKEHREQNPNKSLSNEPGANKDRQAVDKAPGEERGDAEKAIERDLKGKKVDADPSQESDRPAQ